MALETSPALRLLAFGTITATGLVAGAACAVAAGTAAVTLPLIASKLGELGPTVLANLSAESIRTDLEKVLSDRLGTKRDLLANHDISRLVGKSIKVLVDRLAEDEGAVRDGSQRKALKELARRAVDEYVRAAALGSARGWSRRSAGQLADRLWHASVDKRVDAAITNEPLGEAEWRSMLDRIVNRCGLDDRISTTVLDEAARRLTTRCAPTFFELLKDDLADAKGGRAYAAVHLAALGDIRSTLSRFDGETSQLANQLDKLIKTEVPKLATDLSRESNWALQRHRVVLRKLRGVFAQLDEALTVVRPTLHLDPLDPLDLAGTAGESLARQLEARDRAIPLVEREREVEHLCRWLESDHPASVQLLLGAGGSGKTRLALELCDAASALEWDAGFVKETSLTQFLKTEHTTKWSWSRPTLIVLDYAGTRVDDTDALLQTIVNRLDASNGAVRILLIERHLGDEDTDSLARLLGSIGPTGTFAAIQYDEADVLECDVRHEGSDDDTARAIVRATLGADTDDEEVDRLVGLLRKMRALRSPLLCQLVVRLRAELSERRVQSRQDVLEAWWRHEYGIMDRLAADWGIERSALVNAVICCCLRQGLPHDSRELAAITSREAEFFDSWDEQHVKSIRAALERFLGAPSEGEGTLSPLAPDLLAEYALLRWLAGTRAPGRWRGDAAPDHWLRPHIEERPDQVGAFLMRACCDFPDWRESWAFLEQEGGIPSWPREASRAAHDVLPVRVVALADLAVMLCQRLLDEDSPTDERRAGLLNDLSIRLSDLGRREEALEAIEEAVELRRRLAELRPDAFEPALAMSLNNLSLHLSDLGRREEALEAIEEAVKLYGKLAQQRPDAFEPDLAMSLNNLSNRLSALGRREEVLEAIEEAVELRRRLAELRPDAFEPDLASSLNNLSNHLSDLGRREEALEAIEEAVELRRRHAQQRPDAFEPDLASSLNNLSGCLSGLGRREEALEAIEEAVELYRRLAELRPDAFEPHLAMSLNNLSNHLSDLGRREEALEAIEEAVKLRRGLAELRPDAFEPDLAMSLNNLSACLSNLGRREEALEAIEEAVELYRRLAELRPDAFGMALARSFGMQGAILAACDRWSDSSAAFASGISHVLDRVTARNAAAFLTLLETLKTGYLVSTERAGKLPDQELLERAQRVLDQGPDRG